MRNLLASCEDTVSACIYGQPFDFCPGQFSALLARLLTLVHILLLHSLSQNLLEKGANGLHLARAARVREAGKFSPLQRRAAPLHQRGRRFAELRRHQGV